MSAHGGAHVLVTGAAAGIGKATALAFARAGAEVSALDRDAIHFDPEDAGPGHVHPVRLDLRDLDALDDVVAGLVRERGPVRVLVNNAGVDRRMALDELTPGPWREMMALNLDHHAALARLVAPGMEAAGGGAIVNLSSTAWMKLAGNLAAYHAAKAGIVGLTRGLARDLGPKGIRVNAIAPGRVVTERVEAGLTDDWIAETHALQCIPDLIRADDIAEAALWLASPGARMVTGQTLVVDGGVV
ncbi:SDR family oxidoreductase [Roseicyclus sp. F158]|uniref:SDR family oxidoreductase n=1 Tax=Tropicimonas omnivorans TaxID=3075590 RepID=A0ABU3DMQ6_9RHOB|nr:SDR family oxidoreductase [Roseicyclus sp. F158]MDT0684387.1 SDR family oxidoreductase [Roseicyclus sp. F158]